MGASKRIAEIYMQSLSQELEKIGADAPRTRFITTRFGNVLGSNGSVIPRFKQQILSGGPVTVTHPDINRFFMTISEACQLVIEASVMGAGGEIFVFDMGKPVKIVDLAEKMIRLSGKEPGRDIKITFTGLRPGEKLYEEVLSDAEETIPTYHKKILIAKVRTYQLDKVIAQLEELATSARMHYVSETVQLMKVLVPEFLSKNSPFERLDAVNKTKVNAADLQYASQDATAAPQSQSAATTSTGPGVAEARANLLPQPISPNGSEEDAVVVKQPAVPVETPAESSRDKQPQPLPEESASQEGFPLFPAGTPESGWMFDAETPVEETETPLAFTLETTAFEDETAEGEAFDLQAVLSVPADPVQQTDKVDEPGATPPSADAFAGGQEAPVAREPNLLAPVGEAPEEQGTDAQSFEGSPMVLEQVVYEDAEETVSEPVEEEPVPSRPEPPRNLAEEVPQTLVRPEPVAPPPSAKVISGFSPRPKAMEPVTEAFHKEKRTKRWGSAR